MGSAGEAAMEAAARQESGQGSLLNKVYAMQCAQQQQQQQSTVLTVVGGRMVSRAAPMPLNGQVLPRKSHRLPISLKSPFCDLTILSDLTVSCESSLLSKIYHVMVVVLSFRQSVKRCKKLQFVRKQYLYVLTEEPAALFTTLINDKDK